MQLQLKPNKQLTQIYEQYKDSEERDKRHDEDEPKLRTLRCIEEVQVCFPSWCKMLGVGEKRIKARIKSWFSARDAGASERGAIFLFVANALLFVLLLSCFYVITFDCSPANVAFVAR